MSVCVAGGGGGSERIGTVEQATLIPEASLYRL